GLLRSLEGACQEAKLKTPRAELRTAIEGGAATLAPYLRALAAQATPAPIEGEARQKPPALVFSIDQGEELFLAAAEPEATRFLVLLHDLLASDNPAVIAVFTIRSDNYEQLQEARALDGVHQEMLNLPPMPKGSYAEVIKGPVRRLEGTPRA